MSAKSLRRHQCHKLLHLSFPHFDPCATDPSGTRLPRATSRIPSTSVASNTHHPTSPEATDACGPVRSGLRSFLTEGIPVRGNNPRRTGFCPYSPKGYGFSSEAAISIYPRIAAYSSAFVCLCLFHASPSDRLEPFHCSTTLIQRSNCKPYKGEAKFLIIGTPQGGKPQLPNVGLGSGSVLRHRHPESPELEVQPTKTGRKRTSALECRLLGYERSYLGHGQNFASSHEPTFGARQTTSQFGTHVTSVDVVERINACCTSLATIWALSVATAGVILLVSLMQLR